MNSITEILLKNQISISAKLFVQMPAAGDAVAVAAREEKVYLSKNNSGNGFYATCFLPMREFNAPAKLRLHVHTNDANHDLAVLPLLRKVHTIIIIIVVFLLFVFLLLFSFQFAGCHCLGIFVCLVSLIALLFLLQN